MATKDPTKDYLGTALRDLAAAEDDKDAKDFKAGAAFVHRIIREQADITGKEVPSVSHIEYDAYVKAEDEQWETLAEQKAQTGVDPNEQVFKRITSQDPVFEESLLDNIPYPRGDTERFRYGITEAYLPLKRAAETKKDDTIK